MSTHASVAVEHKDGTVTQVYVHADGYPSVVGKLLVAHYNSLELAAALVSQGAIANLCPRITPHSAEHSFATPEEGVTVFYARDRGEELEKEVFVNFGEYSAESVDYVFDYIFRDNEWLLMGADVYRVSTLLTGQKDNDE